MNNQAQLQADICEGLKTNKVAVYKKARHGNIEASKEKGFGLNAI